MQKVPKKISSKEIYSNTYLSVKVDTLESEGYVWEQAYFTKPNKDSVVIIATDRKGVYLIHQYRYASAKYFWQLPAGMIEMGKSEIDAAQAELKEEAGIKAQKWKKIGSFNAEPGMSNQMAHVFVAEGLTKGKKELSPTEKGIEVVYFPFEKIQEMIQKGEIECGFTLSSLLLFQNNYLQNLHLGKNNRS